MAADPNSPDYLKPAPGYGQPPYNPCKHADMKPNEANDNNIYHYICECGAKFHECAVTEVDGKFTMRDFSIKRGKRSARRRSGF